MDDREREREAEEARRTDVLAAAELYDSLPDCFGGPARGDDVPDGLCGSTVVGFGTIDVDTADIARVEGGGLVIDYRTEGSDAVKRLVFSFTELGMWVAYDGPCRAPQPTEAGAPDR